MPSVLRIPYLFSEGIVAASVRNYIGAARLAGDSEIVEKIRGNFHNIEGRKKSCSMRSLYNHLPKQHVG